MKKDIKEQILDTAMRLFNEQGYDQVSMRGIAEKMHISVGNLTYHYKKKEDLVQAAVMRRYRHYKKAQVPQTLEQLHAFFVRILSCHSQSPYDFRHYIQLARLCPQVYRMQLGAMRDTQDIISGALQNLEANGLAGIRGREKQVRGAVDAVMALCIYGVPNTDALTEQQKKRRILNSIWSIFYLFLTQEGIRSFEKLQAKTCFCI